MDGQFGRILHHGVFLAGRKVALPTGAAAPIVVAQVLDVPGNDAGKDSCE